MNTNTITTHDVLAGAYKGKRLSLAACLTHASVDGGRTVLCGKIKSDSICDVGEVEITCPACKAKAAKIALIR